MKLKHLKWTKASHIFEQQDDNGIPTGRRVEETVCGERCCYHNGQWIPYVWLPNENRLKFRDNEFLEFQSGQQAIIRGTKTLVRSSKFFVQQKVGQNWENVPHGLPTRNLKHDYPKPGQCVAYLDFPDAQYDLQVGLRIGLARKTRMGIRLRAPVSGQVRFQWVLDGVEKLPTNYEWIYQGGGPKGLPKKKTGIKLKNVIFGWSYAEADERTISVETNPDETKKVIITFGPYDYIENTWLKIMPDTWGLTETSDDCFGYGGTYYDNYEGGIWVGQSLSNIENIGWIWDNVTAIGTAEDGCYIETYETTYSNNYATANLRIQNTGAPTAWGAAHVPSDCAFEAASVAWNNMGDAATDQSPEIKTLIQARFDGGHSSGNKMSICMMDNGSANNDESGCVAEESGVGAKLRIVYTPASGISIPVAMQNMRGGFNPVGMRGGFINAH